MSGERSPRPPIYTVPGKKDTEGYYSRPSPPPVQVRKLSKYELERAMKVASPKPNPNIIVMTKKVQEEVVIDNTPIKRPSYSSVHVVKQPEKSKYEMERERKAASPKPNPNIINSSGIQKQNTESMDTIRAVKKPEKSKYEMEREMKAANPRPNPNIIRSPAMDTRKIKPLEEANYSEADDARPKPKKGVRTPTTGGWTRKSPLGSPCPERRVPKQIISQIPSVPWK